MGAMTSQIVGVSIRSMKTSKLRVTVLCYGNSPHKGPVTRKMFPFYDVIMQLNQDVAIQLAGTTSPGLLSDIYWEVSFLTTRSFVEYTNAIQKNTTVSLKKPFI